MKTTLNLPDELMKEVKIRAVQESRTLQDTVALLLRRGLEQASASQIKRKHRVKLPLITGTHPAPPGEEWTPERIKDLLLAQEVDHHLESMR